MTLRPHGSQALQGPPYPPADTIVWWPALEPCGRPRICLTCGTQTEVLTTTTTPAELLAERCPRCRWQFTY